MSSDTYYITHVSLGFWPITRPKRSVDKSVTAAQNQVCRALMEERGVKPPSSNFRSWMFREYGWELIDEARQYIGATIEVSLEGERPREFRKKYCGPSFDLRSWLSVAEGEC